jgi:hypothetical protein
MATPNKTKKVRNRQSRIPESLRKGVGPREFEIVLRRLPDNILEIFELSSHSQVTAVADKASETSASTGSMNRFFARLATGLWRIRQKMVKPGTNEPSDDLRIAFRHLDSTWDLLIEEGIEIKDFANQPFNAGMMLKVISHEPTPGLRRDMIIETIKPTVFYKGEPIQIGEVIIGTPEAGQ